MGLWTLLEGFLLLANAFAILNEDRFLAPRGWGFTDFSGGRAKSLKGQLIGNFILTRISMVVSECACTNSSIVAPIVASVTPFYILDKDDLGLCRIIIFLVWFRAISGFLRLPYLLGLS